MFLVAVTRQRPVASFDGMQVHRSTCGPWQITAVTGGPESSCGKTPEGVRVTIAMRIEGAPVELYHQVDLNARERILKLKRTMSAPHALFFTTTADGECFCASSIALLRQAGVPILENLAALPEFFVYRHVAPPRTLYKDIAQIIPGSTVSIELRNEGCKMLGEEWFQLPEPDERVSPEQATDEVFEAIASRIRVLKPAADKVAVPLSGGLDSSILFRSAQRELATMTSYSAGFPFEGLETNIEKKYALSAARAFGADHHYFQTGTAEYLHDFLRAVEASEGPVHHLQSVLLFQLFERGLANGEEIVVSGAAADGIFGNDKLHWLMRMHEPVPALCSRTPFYQALRAVSRLTGKAKRYIGYLEVARGERGAAPWEDFQHILWSEGAYADRRWVIDHFRVSPRDLIGERSETMRRYAGKSLFDLFMLNALLHSTTASIWRTLAMNCGKVLYCPFRTEPVLQASFHIPWKVKTITPKRILRDVARRLEIPEFIITRPKSGFGVLAPRWALPDTAFEPLVPLATKVFPESELRAVQSPEQPKAMIFWNMLNYAVWKRLCISNEPLGVLSGELRESIAREGACVE